MMVITEAANKRLNKLLPASSSGFLFEGYVGTCRGSAPIIKPVKEIEPELKQLDVDGVLFYASEENIKVLEGSHLDYDPSFFGKGLTMTWPHIEGCACDH